MGVSARTALERCDAFAELSEGARERIVAALTPRSYAPGERVMLQGDPADGLEIIAEGQVAVGLMATEAGQVTERLATLGPGAVIGEMALVTHSPRSANVSAGIATHTFALSVADFESIAAEFPELGMVVTTLVGERLGRNARDGMGDKSVGGCTIRRGCGSGSTAVVYRAIEESTRRTVALKMLNHRMRYSPGATARFEQEADLLLPLDHPNIAQVYRRFEALRTQFIVMEYCSGPSLSDVIEKRGPLDEAEVKRIVGQLARSLLYLHGEGILHRDLKPSNVILDDEGTVKLIDFGLAKLTKKGAGIEVTSADVLLGTPLYMSPEQFLGAEGSIATDIYSLGCIAYELASAAQLFQSQTIGELVDEKQSLELPAADAIGRGVSQEFRDVLAAAIPPDPDQRRMPPSSW